MTTISIELEQFISTITQELGYTELRPGLVAGENIDPESLATLPAVMPSFELVASLRYRYAYNSVRLLRLGYILKRDIANFEVGELQIISDQIPIPIGEEQDLSLFVAPTLSTIRTVTQTVGVAINVSLDMITDPKSIETNPLMGVAYRIDDELPAAFPSIRMYQMAALPLSGEL